MAGKSATFMRTGAAGLGAAGLIALFAAGCAGAPSGAVAQADAAPAYVDAARYTGPDRIFRNGHIDAMRPRAAHLEPGMEARLLAAYEGIDGARLAHRVFDEPHAELLDGACERFVKVLQGETLYDIAQYCDVSLSALLDVNPGVRNPRLVPAGELIEVPQFVNYERLALASDGALHAAGAPVGLYVVRPGDTLMTIAEAHLVPASAVAELNPGVDWRALPAGATLRIPAAVQAGIAPPPPSRKPVTSYLGEGDFSGGARGGQGGAPSHVAEVTRLMPYNLKPVGSGAPARSSPPDGVLSVDRRIVKPGDAVRLSARGLPAGATATIYAGPNLAALEAVDEVRVGPDGALDARAPVKKSADIGGVVFSARLEETGQTLVSERVGVLRIEPEETVSEAGEAAPGDPE
ncbi:LysM peptidoglycan-binding domain-containing protein [Amphiplicatus metriothermophilus]|uniref:LysM repeat-containing protein n=1 Tax=Amphiplicatus metriothermophilus TaxID=1519374 RepID=A0A239PKH9_9PROT|nr:LysM domain-containing protein [Amphiplicatus metriothermophilus]MBB5517358.1 LysM repeat protein [Amphiplicatus metriothermophilus]SNT68306.1 LysM repeat-containing protein [Amphiplicatus metriothermophilus]